MKLAKMYLSVFSMLARGSLIRILAVLSLMAAGQYGRFMHRLNTELLLYSTDGQEPYRFSRIEELINFSTVEMTFYAAFLLICICLCLPGCGFGSKCMYTVGRLKISEQSVFVIQAVYNAVILLALFAVELLVCLGMCHMYTSAVPELVSHQTTALAFYRNDFLHAILPMADIAVWIRNGIMIAVLSLAAASFPYKQRRGKFAADIVSYALLCVIFFKRTVGDGFNTFILVFFGLTIAAEVVYNVWMKDEEGEEDEPYEPNPYPYSR